MQQTIGEYLPNTLFQNFRLMEEFPDYKFSFEGAVKYAWFKKYIAEGRWYPSGVFYKIH